MLVLSVRLVVSTTSSSPTQRARESPRYCRMDWRDVRAAVGVEDARVVDHLVADGHHARRLHDAVAVAVDDAQHRADDAARDAAVVEREVLGGVERAVAERAPVARGAALLGLGVIAGCRPSGGSTMSDVWRNARRAKSPRKEPTAFSAFWTPSAICFCRAAHCSSV